MERGVLVQRSMNSRLIIVEGIFAQDPAQVRFAKHDHVVGHSRRIEPMSLSTSAFCQGDRGAIGWSRMLSLLKTPEDKEILEFLRHSEF